MALTASAPARLRASGWLRTLSPLHVGGAERDTNAPLSVAVDGLGRLYVPGSSLAGALRGLRHADPGGGDGPRDEPANLRWGWARKASQDGAVSRIVVRDALIAARPGLDRDGLPSTPLDPARLELRTSAGIDRHHGTAAQGFLFTRTVVPRGCWLRLEIDLNSHSGAIEHDRAYLRHLLNLLADGHLRLGAAVTRGLGHTQLVVDETVVREERFDTPQGLFAALRGEGTTQWPTQHWRQKTPPPRPQVTIEVTWRPAAPVMVRSGTNGLTVDTLPLTTAIDEGTVTLVLPGTSLKGALRARAEHIERTVRGVDAPTAEPGADDTAHSSAFRAQLEQLPAVRALFGSAPHRPGSGDHGRGALIVDDCHAVVSIPADLWNRVHGSGADDSAADDDPAGPGGGGASPLEQLRAYGLERADHVAIDRWTGGAAEGRLYSVLEPHGLRWQPITLTLDLNRLAAAPSTADGDSPVGDAAYALLLLVLRDLQAGLLPLGGATQRGMGEVTVERILLTWPHNGDQVELDAFLRGEQAEHLQRRWGAYLDGTTV